jgi:hypothetical protein
MSLDNPLGSLIGRRAFLAATAAAGLGCTVQEAHGGAAETRIRDFIAMRGALDQQLVIGSVRGHYDGVVDGELTPLFDVVGATFSRYRASDQGYFVESFEQAYFIDSETGSILDQWKNPYTNQEIVVPVAESKPARSLITADLRFEPATSLPETVRFRQFVSESAEIGDEILFVEKIDVDVKAAAPAAAFFYHETTLLRSRRADIDGSANRLHPCQTSFNVIVSWRPWLRMVDRPGHMMAVGYGAYGQQIADLPEPWLRATAKLRPDLLSDPEAALRSAFPETAGATGQK